MPNFNDYKTTSLAWWGNFSGVAAWKLATPVNVWNELMDQLAGIFAAFGSFSSAPTVTTVITPGATPYTYTAGTVPEVLYISGEGIVSVVRHGISLTGSGSCQVLLEGGGQVTITYAGAAPLLVSDTAGISNNVAGVTVALSPTGSPYLYTAGGRMEVIYISGDGITSVKRNGVALTSEGSCVVVLPRGGSVEVVYGGAAPLMISDS